MSKKDIFNKIFRKINYFAIKISNRFMKYDFIEKNIQNVLVMIFLIKYFTLLDDLRQVLAYYPIIIGCSIIPYTKQKIIIFRL